MPPKKVLLVGLPIGALISAEMICYVAVQRVKKLQVIYDFVEEPRLTCVVTSDFLHTKFVNQVARFLSERGTVFGFGDGDYYDDRKELLPELEVGTIILCVSDMQGELQWTQYRIVSAPRPETTVSAAVPEPVLEPTAKARKPRASRKKTTQTGGACNA